MMERLESDFDGAEEASHHDLAAAKQGADLKKHINEAHALESQAIHLYEKSKKIAGDPVLAEVCRRHLDDARRHAELLEERLNTLEGTTSTAKDAALGAGGLNWGYFFQAQPDTPAKLAAFAYAYEHLKIAGYELLKRTALRAGDAVTETLCESLLEEEREMAQELAETFDSAAAATLAIVAEA